MVRIICPQMTLLPRISKKGNSGIPILQMERRMNMVLSRITGERAPKYSVHLAVK